jgi:predicted nucleic acid-binding protein
VSTGDALISSALAWVEVSRALRAATGAVEADRLVDVAMSGVLEKPVSAEVVALARRLDPPVLRSLDAIHLASALLIDADVIVAYDQRLSAAAAHHGIRAMAPHR